MKKTEDAYFGDFCDLNHDGKLDWCEEYWDAQMYCDSIPDAKERNIMYEAHGIAPEHRRSDDEYYAYSSTSHSGSGSSSGGSGCFTFFCIMMILAFILESCSGCAAAPTYELTGKHISTEKVVYLKAGANLRSLKVNEDAKKLAEEEKKQEEEEKKAAETNSTALSGGNGWRRTGAGSVVGSVKLPMGGSSGSSTSGSSTTTSTLAPTKPEKKPLDPYDVYDYDDPYEFADDWAEEFIYDEGFYDDIDSGYDYDDAYDDAWDFAYDYWWKKVKGKRY